MSSSSMKNYIKSPDQKENDKYPEITPGDTEICSLSDREFKIAIIKKFNKLKENAPPHRLALQPSWVARAPAHMIEKQQLRASELGSRQAQKTKLLTPTQW